ncbi:MAG: crossover junction endodeoxyribonuclease RuvC [Candidatus Omnitrophica bacterium]|nr:crossover junction endodeoxyribonuclease RuvC [Candidatus Omnitrophota bacterium]
MVILGIDPAVNSLGFGVVEENRGILKVLKSGCLRPGVKKSFTEKFAFLTREINNLIEQVQPDKIAIEEIYLGENVRVALKIGQIIGMVMGLALRRDIPWVLIPVREVKQNLVGHGAARKEQVRFMVEQLTANRKVSNFDESDALAVAIACVFDGKRR